MRDKGWVHMGRHTLNRIIVMVSGTSKNYRRELTEEEVIDIMRIKHSSSPYFYRPFIEKEAIREFMTFNDAWYKDEEEI